MITFGSLFAGIGGLDLGLERAGLRCVWQCEIDPWCRRVLAKHWPGVRRHDDVRTFPPGDGTEWGCDLIAGGFPCQDISYAGSGAGLDGERSGLWWEFARVVRVVRPRLVLVENVAALLGRGLDAVLGTLASLGYDAEWHCIPAAAVGAPHIRDRVFVLAYRDGGGRGVPADERQADHDHRIGPPGDQGREIRREGLGAIERMGGGVSHASIDGRHARGPRDAAQGARGRQPDRSGFGQDVPDADGERREQLHPPALAARAGQPGRLGDGDGFWATEPEVGRVADGVPRRVDRLRGLGNAVVPQVAQYIGRRIVEAFFPLAPSEGER